MAATMGIAVTTDIRGMPITRMASAAGILVTHIMRMAATTRFLVTHIIRTAPATGILATRIVRMAPATGILVTRIMRMASIASIPRYEYYHSRVLRSTEARREFEAMTRYPRGRPGYVIDHITPLACGGADNPSNIQWQTVAQGKAEDKWERKGWQLLHVL